MPLAPVIAAALTTGGPHAYSLWINGLDVLREPGAPGNRFGVPIETISIEELAPGGVSGMTFTIKDPQAQLTVAGGDYVLMWDHVNDVPLFAGWVFPDVTPRAMGGPGRAIDVSVIGPEALLDWSYCKGGTLVSLDGPSVVQALAGLTLFGAPGIRAIADTTIPLESSQATPIGDWGVNGTITPTVDDGTLRAVLRQVGDWLIRELTLIDPSRTLYPPQFTVDYYLGLRAWAQGDPTTPVPTDYATLTVTDTPPGAYVATEPEHTTDLSDVHRYVYVKGGAAAGTGVVSDGSGRPGPVGVVSQSSSLTGDDKLAWARTDLNNHGQTFRGTLVLDDVTPPANVHPGSRLVFTDTTVGASGTFYIGGISKTFNPSGRQRWTVTYGARPASYIDRQGVAPNG